MQWYELLFSAISLRSFSVLWFWIAFFAFWSLVTRRVMGVPFDLLLTARNDARAADDVMWLARFDVRRRLAVPALHRVVIVGLAAFALSMLLALALTGLEAAQALFLTAAPYALVEMLRLRLAHGLAERQPDAQTLVDALIWHRIAVQAIAAMSVFLTILWGAWRNLSLLM